MTFIGLVLLALAAVICVWACSEYARCSWFTNSDLMGASLAFTTLWLIGAVLVAAGLVIAAELRIGTAIAIGLGFAVGGKVIEWFLIEPVLRWMFNDYRRRFTEPSAVARQPRE